ncbi:hypothetical protein [Streptomyces lincolnensis]|uniref:hypothetical protein n=1 Tax=Streptomyces lincolnensis TaxID=1915 RepID=UPI0037D7ED51
MSEGTKAVVWPDWQVHVLVRTIYLQGPPLWDIEKSVRQKAEKFMTSPLSRYTLNPAKFREKTAKEAVKQRERLWAGKGPFELHLLDLVRLMRGTVEDLIRGDSFPHRWDPVEMEKVIMGGLHCVDTKLTPRQKQAFHLESVIGVAPTDAARAMDVGVKAAQSHLSLGWSVLRENKVDLQAMRWFIESGTEGVFPVRGVQSIEEEIKEEEAAKEMAAKENNAKAACSADSTRKEDSYEGI